MSFLWKWQRVNVTFVRCLCAGLHWSHSCDFSDRVPNNGRTQMNYDSWWQCGLNPSNVYMLLDEACLNFWRLYFCIQSNGTHTASMVWFINSLIALSWCIVQTDVMGWYGCFGFNCHYWSELVASKQRMYSIGCCSWWSGYAVCSR